MHAAVSGPRLPRVTRPGKGPADDRWQFATGDLLNRFTDWKKAIDEVPYQVQQLAKAARSAYVDVRESVLALRTTVGPERSLVDALCEYAELWQDQSGITTELVETSTAPSM